MRYYNDIRRHASLADISPADSLPTGAIEVICPEQFGARGDGVTDDTAALQHALDATANGRLLFLNGGTYAIRSLLVGPSMGGIAGPGTLKGLAKQPMVVLRGESDAPARDILIRGVAFEAGPSLHPILATDAQYTVIEACRVGGLRDGSRGISIEPGCLHAAIRNCRIEAPRDKTLESVVGIVVASLMTPGRPGAFDPAGYFSPPVGQVKFLEETTRDTVIEGNVIVGGTHGIGVGGACRTRILNNTITHSAHRNINLCPAARHNVVMGNHLLESGSSAVAMAYGSSFNLVAHNSIVSRSTTPGADRDAIHAYVACGGNLITGNRISGDFRYGVYLATNAFDNIVQGNSIQLSAKPDLPGDFTVGIGLENDWPERPLPEGARYSRQNFGSVAPHTWAHGDSTGNIIQGNLVKDCTCGFYIAQIGAATAVRANRWDHNTAIGCGCALYAFGGAPEKFRGNILSGLLIELCRAGVLAPPWSISPFESAP